MYSQSSWIAIALLAAMTLTACGGSSGSSVLTPPSNLVGTWGGKAAQNPGDLVVTSTGGTFAFECMEDTLDQPIAPDSTGHFTVTATITGGLPTNNPQTEQLTGSISGSTMTVYVPSQDGTFTLTYGNIVSVTGGGCPAV
jgi:hypothetical protein